MTINIIKARKERKRQYALEQANLEWHYYVMNVISEASRKGMK